MSSFGDKEESSSGVADGAMYVPRVIEEKEEDRNENNENINDRDDSYKKENEALVVEDDDEDFHETIGTSLKIDDPEELWEGVKVVKSMEVALSAKEEGNVAFRNKNYDDAIEFFSKAVAYCPTDDESKDSLSTFYGNRSAAYFSLEEFDMVVEDCSQALVLNPTYVKVIVRRMQAYEKLDRMEEALQDAKKVQEIDPKYPQITSTITRLQKVYDERMNKMKDEALGKLKDLGNSILGNFGMSLDSFKMQQDPSTGSWNISMNNK